MGCSNSKVTASNPAMRMLEYQKMAEQAELGFKIQPNFLDNEDWREGLISARTFYNWFHAGFCSAYIQNPQYMLIIDFRSLEDWHKERVKTAIHYKHFNNFQKFTEEYTHIILYDKDGSSIGNIRSPIRRMYLKLKSEGMDPRIILGGFKYIKQPHFASLRHCPNTIPYASQDELEVYSTENLDIKPKVLHSESETEEPEYELETVRPSIGKVEPERKSISWNPTMILENRLYLGQYDQAANINIVKSLGITHILSTSRTRISKIKGLVYIMVNKTSFSLDTIKLTNSYILEALNNGGKILVHGCDGLDQSAAVVIASLMVHHTATLEDSLYFVAYSRPGLCLSNQRMRILWELENEMFGKNITELETLWI
eukprot:TRINITY_DN37003_c0_g1_i1.p1 TRINITY_DN37003_c0_g1~~TRINITY_DN37003_c0_g1_i1.p1  ORF type:complete len:371 (+),score=52.63 TRINITY_DN37003_c0_g1_i1:180-1292(+)